MTERETRTIRTPENNTALAPAPVADPAAELGSDLHDALGRHMDWALRAWRETLAEVEKKQAGYVAPGERDDLALLRDNTRFALDAFGRVGKDRSPSLDDRAASAVSWHDLVDEVARDQRGGMALWEKVKGASCDELAAGKTGAEVVEPYHHTPWHRARYFALRAALADGLAPRNGMEWLLLDGMAQALTMHAYWLNRHVETDSLDEWDFDRKARERGEFVPPRLSAAETVDRAAMMADRFSRQFLRLMRTYRDGRKLLSSVTMLGGQLNVAGDGGQQVIATRTIRATSAAGDERRSGVRRRIRRRDDRL